MYWHKLYIIRVLSDTKKQFYLRIILEHLALGLCESRDLNGVVTVKQQLSLDTELSPPFMKELENRVILMTTSNIHGRLWHTDETVMKGTINMTHTRFPNIAASFLNPISRSPVSIITSTITSGRPMNTEGKYNFSLATRVGSWQCLQLECPQGRSINWPSQTIPSGKGRWQLSKAERSVWNMSTTQE